MPPVMSPEFFDKALCLFDVDGVPVSGGHPEAPGCKAWDTDPPRTFSPESVESSGRPVPPATFAALVAEARKSA